MMDHPGYGICPTLSVSDVIGPTPVVRRRAGVKTLGPRVDINNCLRQITSLGGKCGGLPDCT